jgi:Flp pilus assembly protein TadG
MLALVALPMLSFVGAAIDFSRAASARTAMQAALDASALMLSKDAQTLTPTNLMQKAGDDFRALFTRPEAYDIQITPQFSQPAQGNFTLKVTASAKVDTTFARLLGQSTISLSASTESAVRHQEAQSRARSRQHRVDATERQDDQPEDCGA